MGQHLKRVVSPKSWGIAKKTDKFVTKPSPGPHNINALPVIVWARDQMGIARTKKEVNQILEADFDKTGLRLEALQDGLNFNTKNYLDQVKLEKNTTSQFLSDLDKHIDLEVARRNDHDNDQTLGR